MINPEMLNEVADYCVAHLDDADLNDQLRNRYEGVTFTLCDEDELASSVSPVLERDGVNFYLVGGEHCLGITNIFEHAKGIVVANVEEDDD